MSVIAENSVEINSNINNIYAYISNMENYAKWFPDVIAIKSENSQNHGTIGKKYLETIKIPLKGENEYSIEVKESRKNEKFVTECEMQPLLPRMIWDFTEISQEVSQVNWKIESRSKKLLFKLVFLPLIRSDVSKKAQQGILNLKQILEKE